MKYVQPLGEAADASYVDGNRSAGTKGSVVPAAAVEYPQREIDHVISFFGLTPANTDLQQLRKAIEAAIAAATGGGDTSQFLLVSQARARLPIFPEILSADGKMNVTSPSAGTVQVPTAVDFLHRGIYPVSTSDYIEADRTFATLANKTYHLRWNPTDGFLLEDLADSGYNPSVLAETDATFDADYDDAFISRIVTSAGNVATIKNLVNKAFLKKRIDSTATASEAANNSWAATHEIDLDWARTPDFVAINSDVYASAPITAKVQGGTNKVTSETYTRYAITHQVATDWDSTPSGFSGVTSAARGGAVA